MINKYKVYFKAYSIFHGKTMSIRYQTTVQAINELSARDKAIENYNKSHYSNLPFEVVDIQEADTHEG